MPEEAYQSPTAPAKRPVPRNKSSLVAIAKSANPHNKGLEADDAAQKTSLAAVAAQSPADLSKLISKVLEFFLAQFGIKLNKQPNPIKPSGASERKGAYRKTCRNSPPKERKGSPLRKSDGSVPSPRLASAKNIKTTRLAPRRVHVAGGVADQAIPKAIAPSVLETTSGTTK